MKRDRLVALVWIVCALIGGVGGYVGTVVYHQPIFNITVIGAVVMMCIGGFKLSMSIETKK